MPFIFNDFEVKKLLEKTSSVRSTASTSDPLSHIAVVIRNFEFQTTERTEGGEDRPRYSSSYSSSSFQSQAVVTCSTQRRGTPSSADIIYGVQLSLVFLPLETTKKTNRRSSCPPLPLILHSHSLVSFCLLIPIFSYYQYKKP